MALWWVSGDFMVVFFVGLQWLYGGFLKFFLWVYDEFLMGLRWLLGGFFVGLLWLYGKFGVDF